MPEIAAEKKGSRNPEVPADIVILFVLMSKAERWLYHAGGRVCEYP